MLLRSQLEELAKTLTNGNTGHVEKLYLQDIALHSIYQEVVDELVFKGGTVLLKLYNLDRFSEDLDFTAAGEIDLVKVLESVERHLESFGAKVEKVESGDSGDSFNARLGVQGPLYTGNELSLSFFRIEVNRRAEVENPIVRRYTPNFPDVPAFEILTLTEEEILAEKIRGLVIRNRPRDLYDIYHLLDKGVEINEELVEKKLEYYDLAFDPATILKEARKNRKSWGDLENLIYSRLPEFDGVLDLLMTGIEKKKQTNDFSN